MNRAQALAILRTEAEDQNRARIEGKPVDPGALYAVIEWLERQPLNEDVVQNTEVPIPDQPAPNLEEARPPDRNSGHSPEEVVNG